MCHSHYLVLTVIFTVVIHVSAITTRRYMTSYCNPERPIYVNDSIILELTNQILKDTGDKYIHCSATVTTEPSRKLLLHFVLLAISFENETPDSLHIYDIDKYGNSKELTPKTGLFGIHDAYYSRASAGVGDYLSSRNKFRLNYIGKPSLTYSGFRLLITTVKDTERDGTCSRMFRKCSNKNICTPLSVWCDSDSNCGQGDKSDEESCDVVISNENEYKYIIVTSVVTAVVAIVIFLLVIAIVACVLLKYSRRNYLRSRGIHVYAKKSEGDWKIANDMGLSLQMGPPKYDDVIGLELDEPPPSYDAVTTPRGSTHFDDDCTTVVIHTRSENGDSAIQLSACNSESSANDAEQNSGYSDDIVSSHNMSASSSGDSCHGDDLSNHEKHAVLNGSISNETDTDPKDVQVCDKSSVENTPKRVDLLRHSVSLICDEIEYIDTINENSNNVQG